MAHADLPMQKISIHHRHHQNVIRCDHRLKNIVSLVHMPFDHRRDQILATYIYIRETEKKNVKNSISTKYCGKITCSSLILDSGGEVSGISIVPLGIDLVCLSLKNFSAGCSKHSSEVICRCGCQFINKLFKKCIVWLKLPH